MTLQLSLAWSAVVGILSDARQRGVAKRLWAVLTTGGRRQRQVISGDFNMTKTSIWLWWLQCALMVFYVLIEGNQTFYAYIHPS